MQFPEGLENTPFTNSNLREEYIINMFVVPSCIRTTERKEDVFGLN
jgi:hypothetical protein